MSQTNRPSQVVNRGVVVGFVDGQPDLVRVFDGFYCTVAYVPGATSDIQVGQQFNLYKQDNLYHLGAEVNH